MSAQTKRPDEIDDSSAPLIEHLAELRSRLIWSALAFIAAMVVCYMVWQPIYNFLTQPICHALSARGQSCQLQIIKLQEGFFTAINISFFGGFVLAFPVIGYQLWRFIAPGLYRSEKSAFMPFLLASPVMFLIGASFARASGMTLLQEPHPANLAGTPTLLMHGDTLCSDDIAYQNFRSMVRTSTWCDDFLARPLAARKAQIKALRRHSEQEKQIKSAAIMDVNADTVAATLRAHGYPRLIHGHTHRQGQHTHHVDDHACERWVLGDWHDSGNYLSCDASGCRFHALTLPA